MLKREELGEWKGRVIKVSFNDCCIYGSIIGTLQRIDEEEDEMILDVGTIGPVSWGSWDFEVVDEGD